MYKRILYYVPFLFLMMSSNILEAQLGKYNGLSDSCRQMCELMESKLSESEASRNIKGLDIVDRGLHLWFVDCMKELETLKRTPVPAPNPQPKRNDENWLNASITTTDIYLNQTFQEMSIDYLRQLKNFYAPYKTNENVSKRFNRITILIECVQLQRNMDSAMCKKFNLDNLYRLYTESDKIKDYVTKGYVTENQQKAFRSTIAYITRYSYGVELFKALITDIRKNTDISDYRKHGEGYRRKMAKDAAMAIFEKRDKDIGRDIYGDVRSEKENGSAFQFFISHIPYLDERFEQYRTAMFTDPVAQDKIENEILSIKVQ